MKPPIVVNMKFDEYDIAIRRPTIWENPFIIGRDGTREEVIEKFRRWVPTQPHIMARLHELSGQRIGCVCHPKPCHGDVYVELVKALPEPESR